MVRFLLIRHGESMGNVQGIFLGQTDAPLSEKGMAQAELAASYIVTHEHVDGIYASDLRRAYDTAAAVAKKVGLPIHPEPALREIYAGAWENKAYADLPTLYPADWGVWLTDIGRSRCTGGESAAEVQARAMRRMTELALQPENDGKTLVIAAHAMVLRCMMTAMRSLPLSEMKNVPFVHNASITTVRYDKNAAQWHFDAIGRDDFLGALATALPRNV